MPNLLGLSIDVGSIGWTLIDSNTQRIKSMGTHVFPLGSENFGSGSREISKVTLRTQHRGERMRNTRKKLRKNFLLKILIKHKMCPLDLKTFHKNNFSNLEGNSMFLDWVKKDPYELRERAIHEKISLEELGRVCYHISMRRGFSFGKRDGNSKPNSLFRGIPAFNRRGISELAKEMNDDTLGVYLNSLLPIKNSSYVKSDKKVRNRFVDRKMYIDEVNHIWEFQNQYHKTLTNTLKQELIGNQEGPIDIKGAVFFQKPLSSQKHKVGKCVYEPKKTNC